MLEAILLKIKVRPEDFIVREIAKLALVKKGEFGVYLLQKAGWNTVELLHAISRALSIPFKDISYGGRKDRWGVTTQHVTIRSAIHFSLKEEDYSLSWVGWMNRAMGPDLIQENSFCVTVRKLGESEVTRALTQCEIIKQIGFANYFDDQRFGSFDERGGFLAEKVLKKEFNGALKIYLTAIRKEERKKDKERKQFFFDHWRDWLACEKKAATEFERSAFAFLRGKPTAFLEVLKRIPREELATHFSCYQSFLWNDLLRKVIAVYCAEPFKRCAGVAGDYVFYARLTESEKSFLGKLRLPMPGKNPEFPNAEVSTMYTRILESRGVRPSSFGSQKLRQAFFKSFLRPATAAPRLMRVESLTDELYPGKNKMTLYFNLPRGSYATMLIKSIF